MDKAKAIKKFIWMNKWSLDEICKMVGVSMQEAARLYKQYTGQEIPEGLIIVGQDDVIAATESAILKNKHVLLHGAPAIGKTISARMAIRNAGKIIKTINLSDKRTKILLSETLFGGHLTESDVVYLFDEADNFHWQSHAYFKKVLEESRVSIVMTVNDINGVSKTIRDWLKKKAVVIPVYPPTKSDLRVFMAKRFPDQLDQLNEIYSKNFRAVMRKLLYGFGGEEEEKQEFGIQAVAGAILGEKNLERRLLRIKSSKDPLIWAITWLDYNAPRFFRKLDDLADFMEKLATIESRIRKTSQQYIQTMLAGLPCPGRKLGLKFPAALFNAERKLKIKEEDRVKKVKVEKAKVEKKVPQAKVFDPFDF
jgi:hypothetical protein